LSKVAAEGDIELFDHLVSRGADPHRSYSLHSVSRCNDPEKSIAMIDHLLDVHHMNIEADDYDLCDIMYFPEGGTPLHSAAYKDNLNTLAHLLKRGANPECGIGTALGTSFREGSKMAVLALLLDAGANADGALDEAVEKNLVDAAEMCLAHGADPTQSIEMSRARDARTRARREPGWVDDKEADLRTRMRALLRVAGESQQLSAEEVRREK
jgi:ankyrin repeat protein